jgi:hypothetical protein
MKKVVLALALGLPTAVAAFDYHRDRPAPGEGFAYPECYCTNRGARVEIGETACLRVGGRRFTALCAMSLNNPAWREVEDGCPPDGLSAAPEAGPANPRSAPG